VLLSEITELFIGTSTIHGPFSIANCPTPLLILDSDPETSKAAENDEVKNCPSLSGCNYRNWMEIAFESITIHFSVGITILVLWQIPTSWGWLQYQPCMVIWDMIYYWVSHITVPVTKMT